MSQTDYRALVLYEPGAERDAGGMVQVIDWVSISGVLLSSAISCILGVAIGIISVASPEKRKKYVLKALNFYLGFFGGFLFVIFLEKLADHLERRRAFKQWRNGVNEDRT